MAAIRSAYSFGIRRAGLDKSTSKAHGPKPRLQCNKMQNVYSICKTDNTLALTPSLQSIKIIPSFPPIPSPESPSYTHPSHCAFCCCALAALAAFLRLLRTMTTLRKLPTTAPPSSSRMTGMRMAQTRGGKRDWIACESSTKGCEGGRVLLEDES